MLAGVSQVFAARGKKVLELDPRSADERAALERAVIGPSGNLRAPAARLGRTMLVGFNAEMWSSATG